jgi:acyl-coenzyme A synthetase/AMP-(fatty) acid ligase
MTQVASTTQNFDIPDCDENARSTTFYPTGTTGNPKGVSPQTCMSLTLTEFFSEMCRLLRRHVLNASTLSIWMYAHGRKIDGSWNDPHSAVSTRRMIDFLIEGPKRDKIS